MRSALRPLAALAMAALISAGCSSARTETGTGGSGGSTTAVTAPTQTGSAGGGGDTPTIREQGVKFATCMRSNGVSEFPDPDASGALTVDGVVANSKLDPSSAAWKKAIGACEDLQPPGFTGNKRSAHEQENALKFAQCIRDNGVKDFPDPEPDGPLVDTNRIPSASGNGGMGVLNAAMQKCRNFAADTQKGPR